MNIQAEEVYCEHCKKVIKKKSLASHKNSQTHKDLIKLSTEEEKAEYLKNRREIQKKRLEESLKTTILNQSKEKEHTKRIYFE